MKLGWTVGDTLRETRVRIVPGAMTRESFLSLFPEAAITKCQRLGSLHNRSLFSPGSEARKSAIKVSAGPCSLSII